MTIATLLFALIALPSGAERSGEPIMLDFTSASCGPCRSMKPVVEQLVQKGYPIKPVDIVRSPDLAERYQVSAVPCFVVIDPSDGRELARSSGAQPGSNLVDLYRQAKVKLEASTRAGVNESGKDRDGDDRSPAAGDRGDDDGPSEAGAPNPKPWETVVRIKVHGHGFMGYGSGTIIASNPRETIILTCAHIFKLEGRRQAEPSKFPSRITIDLFDGKLTTQHPRQVHYSNESFDGEALDYDFGLDVGLIRIRPGRRLPYAKVVPPYWKPKAGMSDMMTVGCSEGHDATAWSTKIVNPAMKGLNGNAGYEAIVCTNAPKQGRSGGGLFTSDGYIAGVCDFAEPTGNHGLYAAPTSIYKVLDRNRLTALYTPGAPDRLIAGRRPSPRNNGAGAGSRELASSSAGAPQFRGQSPDHEESTTNVTLPPPEFLNIKTPVVAANGSGRDGSGPAQGTIRRQSWHASASSTTPPAETQAVEQKLDPSLDTDRFDDGKRQARPVEPEGPTASPDTQPSQTPRTRPAPGKWKAGRSPLPALAESGAN